MSSSNLYATCVSPIMHLICPPQILHNLCSSFLLGITAVPREIENNSCAFFLGGEGMRCIMGDVQVAYTSSLHPGAKSAGKRKGAGHYGIVYSSHKATRLRNKQLQLQTLFPQNEFPHRFPHNWMQNVVVLEHERALLSFNSFTGLWITLMFTWLTAFFSRVFSSLGILKGSLFYVFGWIVTCTLQGWRRLNSRLKYKEKFKEKLRWKIEILILFKKITIFRSNSLSWYLHCFSSKC